MQVHPCGQYRKNTVMSILEAEHKTGPLFRILPGSLLESLVYCLQDLKLSARRKRSSNQTCDVCFIFSEDERKLLHYWNLGKSCAPVGSISFRVAHLGTEFSYSRFFPAGGNITVPDIFYWQGRNLY